MESVGKELTGLVVGGVRQDPIVRVIGIRVSSPLDVVQELALTTYTIIF